MSADPLTVHALGADLNLYAYVSGHALKAIDPLGLEETDYRPALKDLGGPQPPPPPGTSSYRGVTVQHLGGGQHQSSKVEIKSPDARASAQPAPTRPGSRPGEEVIALLGHVGASAIPGVGEAMDVETLTDPNSSTFEKGAAIASLGASYLSAGVLPNFGAIRRGLGVRRSLDAAENVADAASHSRPPRMPEAHGAADRVPVGSERAASSESVASRVKAKDRRAGERARTNQQKHGDADFEQPASESYAQYRARQSETRSGKDARRKGHDAKKRGEGDRSKRQIDEDYE